MSKTSTCFRLDVEWFAAFHRALSLGARRAIVAVAVQAGPLGLRMRDLAERIDRPSSYVAHQMATLQEALLVLPDLSHEKGSSWPAYCATETAVQWLAGLNWKADELVGLYSQDPQYSSRHELAESERAAIVTHKALDHPLRVYLLAILANKVLREPRTNALAHHCKVSSDIMSRHLRILEDEGLLSNKLTRKKDGIASSYNVTKKGLKWLEFGNVVTSTDESAWSAPVLVGNKRPTPRGVVPAGNVQLA